VGDWKVELRLLTPRFQDVNLILMSGNRFNLPLDERKFNPPLGEVRFNLPPEEMLFIESKLLAKSCRE
jgi:hypothetical protein